MATGFAIAHDWKNNPQQGAMFLRRSFARFGHVRLCRYGTALKKITHDEPDVELLAREAVACSEEYRLYQALELLQSLGDEESAACVAEEIEKIEETMSAWSAPVPEERSIAFALPESVAVVSRGRNGFGLVAARDFDEGEVVFSETPVAVVSEGGPKEEGCLCCLRPLAARHVLRASDGKVLREFGAEQVEQLFAQCGLDVLEPTEV